jgi:iron complex outermembrane recepter protein
MKIEELKMRTRLLVPSPVSLGALGAPVHAQQPAEARGDEPNLESITIIAKRLTNVLSAGKSDTSIKETPYSISIVDRDLIELRTPRNFSEVMRTIPGLSQTSPKVGTQNVVSRGFSMRQAGGEFRNALRRFQDANIAPEMTNVERFEIVKGPASVLYGIGGLGGALNVVTKVPTAERRYEFEAGIGS